MFKKRFISISVLLFLIAFIFVVAFNGGEKPEPAEEAEEVAAPAMMLEGTQKEIAEALAKKYAGTTITMTHEGLAVGPPAAFAPIFEKATGVKVNVIGIAYEEMKSKAFTEHEARTGAVDVYCLDADWLVDFAAMGVIQPIDDMIKKYISEDDYRDMYPGQRIATMEHGGETWGLLVDGDIFILYYRADIFEDPAAQSRFKSRYGYDLAAPKSWEQYNQIGQFITDFTDGEVYGGAGVRLPGGTYPWFLQIYRGAGGRIFDPDTMEPIINGKLGKQTLEQMMKELEYGPPGMENWGIGELWSEFVNGKVAMQFSWPPIGRFSEAASGLANYPEWLPPTKVAGKVKYALIPGPIKGDGPPAAGVTGNILWCVSADTKNREAAFAWMMWINSPEMALKTSLYPNSLFDPYRYSQFESPEYRAAWPNAPLYLETLMEAGKYAIPATKTLGGTEYDEIVDRLVSSVMGGQDIQNALDDAADKLKAVVNRLGQDRVKTSYKDFLKLQDQIREAY
ncbi:MAG: sugar ABC transporter substrate-binding protein [Spirochaetota bacterium]|nr:MAG: sugar ABC transporter substrate-binding protein [Spirochaetota bacterium]